MTRRQFLLLVLPLLAVILGFLFISIAQRSGAGAPTAWDERFEGLVRETLAREFVGDVRDPRLAWEAYFNAMNAYVRTFDEHAEVTPPWAFEEERQQTSGQYGGIGVLTESAAREKPVESIRIQGVKPGGPAAQAGILVGEEILAVDGHTILDLTSRDDPAAVERAIRGPVPSKVRLGIRSRSGATRDVEVARADISSGSVFGARIVDASAGIGYVRVAKFLLDTATDFRRSLEALKKEGIRALVLDLRGNGGGLLPQAIDVANALLPRGAIVRTRGRAPGHSEVHEARPEAVVAPELPLVILVNRYSASASEVLAGALQDHRRGLLVGEPTYGKFKVQTVREVETEAGWAVLKFTTSVYETPYGGSHQRDGGRADPLAGLRPDLQVWTAEAEQLALLERFREEVYAGWSDEAPPARAEFVDRPLAAAIALLKGETYYPELVGGS